jgi:hypothetical protein
MIMRLAPIAAALLLGVAAAQAAPNAPPPQAVSQSSTHEDYMRDAKQHFEQWQQRMADWSHQAKAKGDKVSAATRRDLDRAWSNVKVDWKKLQTAAPQDWAKARARFEDASRTLQRHWQDLQAKL